MTQEKRNRIGDKKLIQSEFLETQPFVLIEPTSKEDWTTQNGEFDWDAYTASCVSHTKKKNQHVKTQNKDKVYSREKYAQSFYDLIVGRNDGDLIPIPRVGQIIDGKIYSIGEEWMMVDVGYRELIYVKISKEPSTTMLNYNVGDTVAVLIVDNNQYLLGSISAGMKQKIFRDLQQGVEDCDTAWIGTVTSMIENGGYVVEIQGVNCFMPGSLAGINKLHDFTSIIGQEIYVVPVSFAPDRGTIVVSHRKYLQVMIPTTIQQLKANIDQKQIGHVTGTAKYGVFCEFNECLTGMIHINDLDEETSNKFKNRTIKPGDAVEFYVKDIISNDKITLSQRVDTIYNPWKDVDSRYKVPCNVEATVKTKKDYGLFITVEEGLVGLLHVSELDESVMQIYNPGDKITVQINRIDKDSQKIFLKLPK
jgi:small subunit ribosomal protein S1